MIVRVHSICVRIIQWIERSVRDWDILFFTNSITHRVVNNTFAKCVAGQRITAGNGKVVFIIDGAEVLSEDDFTYTDNPQVSSLVHNQIIQRYTVLDIIYNTVTSSLYSGGVDLIFTGRNLNVIKTRMVVDIVDATDDPLMSYTIVSVWLLCVWLAI